MTEGTFIFYSSLPILYTLRSLANVWNLNRGTVGCTGPSTVWKLIICGDRQYMRSGPLMDPFCDTFVEFLSGSERCRLLPRGTEVSEYQLSGGAEECSCGHELSNHFQRERLSPGTAASSEMRRPFR